MRSVPCLSPGSYGFGLETYCLNLLDPTPAGYSTGIEGNIAYFESNTRYESPPIPVAWLLGTVTTPGSLD
jgi:hypothetical protein